MYICVCSAVTERQVQEAVASGQAQRLRDLKSLLGVASVCGECAGCAHACLRKASADSVSGCAPEHCASATTCGHGGGTEEPAIHAASGARVAA